MNRYLYALDLSMSCSGVVIFDLDTKEPVFVVSINTKDKETHGQRLHTIKSGMAALMYSYPPTEIAIERGFSRFNLATQAIYRVHGVINELLRDYKQFYYPPKQVKAAIIKGDATKAKVRAKIEQIYPNIKFRNEDESDAFAVGITHLVKAHKMQWKK